ncbi:MAG: hypothetical protein MR575_05715 [Bacteroides sp.]|nr:hypothetical protein [Bacteroides sp.]
MMKMKKEYQTPLLSVRRIEMESGFCSASADVHNPKGASGEIEEHTVNQSFTTDFDASGWE